MSKLESESAQHYFKEPRGEKLVATYAQRHVRQYDSYDPRLIIDLLEEGKQVGKIIADNFPAFETGLSTQLDRVELIRGHHKARLIFAIGKSIIDEEGIVKHEVYSPDGFIGFAKGDNLDFYIASLFYDDPKIKEFVKKGEPEFDKNVQKYLEYKFQMPNLFKA